MQAIAAHADVGIGTLYNYFSSKGALLLGLCNQAADDVLESGQQVVAHPGTDGAAAVLRLLTVYAGIVQRLERALLQDVLAVAHAQGAQSQASFAALDMRLAGQLGTLLVALQTSQQIRMGVDLEAATLLLYGIFGSGLMLYAAVPDMSFETLMKTVRTQVQMAFDGLRPAPSGAKERP